MPKQDGGPAEVQDDLMGKAEPRCKGCGKKIFWIQTPEGKKIPLDLASPVYLITDKIKSLGTRSDPQGDYVYAVSHFSTCSKANDFSASKKSKINS